MSRLSLALRILALALPVPCLAAPVPVPTSIPVTGWVGDAHGRPLAGARVTLAPLRSDFERQRLALAGEVSPEPTLTAKSDTFGGFTLAAPEAGMWTARIEAAGAVPVELDLVPLVEVQELPPFLPALSADAGVEVRVLDPAGRPVPAAGVAAEATANPGSADFWRPATRRGQTGADGRVRLPRTRDERLRFRVLVPGYPMAEVESSLGTVEIRLAPGLPQVVEVRGADGRPAAGVPVAAGPGLPASALTDGNGRATVFATAKTPVRKIRPLAWTADGRPARAADRPPGADPTPALAIVLPKPAAPRAGQVVDRLDRRPLAGALVWPLGSPAAFVRADARGGYALAAGKPWTAAAAALGHLLVELSAPPPARGEQALHAPTFALAPAAAVLGTVVDAAGRPLAGVLLSASPAPSLFAEPVRAVRARSGGEGGFALRSLATGLPYVITANHKGFATARLTLAELKPLAVRSGLRIVLKTGRAVRGRVVDGGGQPVDGAMVLLTVPEAGASPLAGAPATVLATRTDAAGRFEVEGLLPGKIDLAVRAPGFALATRRQLAVPAGEGALDLGAIALDRGLALAGRVVDREGRPVAGATVRVDTQSSRFERAGGSREHGEATTGADGGFTVSGLSSGHDFGLAVERDGFATRTLTAVKPPLPEPLKIALSPAARLAGDVVDESGAPVPGTHLRVQGEMSLALLLGPSPSFPLATADDDGHFELRDAPPGKGTLRAVALGFLPATIPVEVSPGQSREDLHVVLHRGSTVAGRVLGADGAPAAGAKVSLAAQGRVAGPSGNQTHADGDGGYVLDAIPEGPQSFSAEMAGAVSAVRDLTVRPGENRLDFQLADGLEIAGRVVDTAGAPVAGARVTASAGDPLPSETASGDDGSFRFAGLRGGTYRLAAQLSGVGAASQEVRLADAPIRDVELRLAGGGAVVGRVLGLSPEQLAQVRVTAFQTSADLGSLPAAAVPDAQGEYRIGDLPPGEWSLMAMVGLPGRMAHGQVRLPPGVPEVRLDLEFSSGFTLSGRLRRAGQPVPGIIVTAHGTDVESSGTGFSSAEGAFRLEGLKAGTYELVARSLSAGQLHKETLEISADREVEIDLPASEVRGRVIDADDGSPVAEAAISLEPVAVSGANGSSGTGMPGGVQSGPDGTFALDSPAEGDFRVVARKDGYAPAEATVHLAGGSGADDVKLSMSLAAGLRFTVRDATGSSPATVSAALLDPAGQVLLSGNYPVSVGGRVRISEVPAGHWLLLVAAGNSATATAAVDIPGMRAVIDLPDRTRLTILVPELAGKPGTANLKIVGVGGLPYRSLRFGFLMQEMKIADGRLELEDLPPGAWQLRVEAPGGKVFQGSAITAPGAPVVVSLK